MTDEIETPKDDSIGAGAILKQARKSMGLTVADIASKIHLKVTIIEAIEADNYDPAISVTFTKGYLKLYAKQVKVPESVVLDAFGQKHEQEKEPAKLQSFSRRVAKQSKDDRLMLLTYAIIIGVIALVVVWWVQQESSEDANTSQSTISQSITSSTDTTISEVEPSTELAPTRDDLIVSGQLDVSALEAQQDRAQANTNGLTNDDSAPDEQTALDVSQAIQSPEPEQQIIELVFEFSENCWMNLIDATGEAIAYGEKKAGRVMTVSGVAPFQVTLGAPQAVQISYDGVAVDMSRFGAGTSAKFTLPFSSL